MITAPLLATALAVFILLAGPFGEGGRLPAALAALHAAVLALVLAAGWRALASGGGRPRGRGTGVLLAAVALPGLGGLAAIGAAYPYAAGLGLMDRLAAAGALVAAAFLLTRPADLLLLRNVTVASVTLQAFLALVGAWQGGPAVAARVFLNRNHLGAFLNIGLLLAVTAAEEARARRDRRGASIFAAAAVVHLMALLALRSRGALLGIAAAAVLLVAHRWRGWTPRVRAAAIGLTVAVLLGGAALVVDRFARSDDPDRWRRVGIWEASLGMVAADPILGIGPGQFPHEAPRHNFPVERTPVRYGRWFRGAHSAYLTLAVEDGVPAALVLLAGIAAAVTMLVRRPGEGPAGAAVLGTAAALSALAAQGGVEDLQERPAVILTAALLAGSALAVSRGWRGGALEARRRVLPAAALAVLIVWVGAAGVALPYVAWHEAQAARAGGREALSRMRRAARLDPANAEYHHDLAMAALNSGPPNAARYADAALELDEARRLHPREARFVLLRARLEALAARSLFEDAGADRCAAAWYAEAAALSPTDPRPHLEQAGFLADRGRDGEALAALARALAIEPHYRRARILELEILIRAGRAPEAREAWTALLASDAEAAGYGPESGYAAEIVADAPTRRAAIEAAVLAATPARTAGNR
jgi:O-antigen ligase/Flp pilus assembly protein TadD